MFYTNMTLNGLESPVDYGSGIEYAAGLWQHTDIPALQIGLWLAGATGCREILQGTYDTQIQHLYQTLVGERRLRQVFLRVGYEFDNPQFGYVEDPTIYRAAFRYMVNRCRGQCRHKIDFVWHSWAASLTTAQELVNFYPGTEYVDWVAVSLFTQFYPGSALGRLNTTVQPVLDWAVAHGHPIMIAESTPYGGIDTQHDPWADWFAPTLRLIEDYHIELWSYIDANWTQQPMWKYAGFGNTLLDVNSTVLRLWHSHVLSNPRFVMATDFHCIHSFNHSHEHNIALITASVLSAQENTWTSAQPLALFVLLAATLFHLSLLYGRKFTRTLRDQWYNQTCGQSARSTRSELNYGTMT